MKSLILAGAVAVFAASPLWPNPGIALNPVRGARAEALNSHPSIGWDRHWPQTTC